MIPPDNRYETPGARGEGELATPLGFVEMLRARQASANTLLCVGLDPVVANIPDSFKKRWMLATDKDVAHQSAAWIGKFNEEIVDAVAHYVSAFKPNVALYERYGVAGWQALKSTIRYIKSLHPDIPVILDAKRADIGASNQGYVDMVKDLGADAITVNPYFGIEGEGALGPFLNMEDMGVIILCRTSNPEAAQMQDVIVKDPVLGEVPYYMMIARMAEEARQKNPNVAIVVGATAPGQLRAAREIFKGQILVPGLGKQGGTAPDLMQAFDDEGFGVIANNASAIIHASREDDYAQAATQKAREWRDKINAVREASAIKMPDRAKVVEAMTLVQRTVAEMMLTAVVDGKLTRRIGAPGSFEYPKKEGRFPMVTIAQDPEHEFAGAANQKDPQNPDIPLLPYYANLRGGTQENYKVMARALAEALAKNEISFDYITGIPSTGNAIAIALAGLLGKQYYEILEKSGEGTDREFHVRAFRDDEPRPEPDARALLIDDLITRARTKKEAEEELVKSGFEVSGHGVVYDREEGGMEEMQEAGIEIVAGLTATQLFAVAREIGKVSDEGYDTILGKIVNGKRERALKRAA
ncbi:MAG: orotidine-5'-phosphate decarboxylase [Candidatus Levyibacteriota bacterium]|jgi:orotidine-5'-phosphate decarboxylase